MKTKTAKLFTSTALGILTILLTIGIAHAQMKPWNVINNVSRFQVVADSNGAMILDRETGLIWMKDPLPTLGIPWSMAIHVCINNTADGGRRGWRLPTAAELMSLMVNNNLPTGHPFNIDTIAEAADFWSSTTDPTIGTSAYRARFGTAVSGPGPISTPKTLEIGLWCVRGGGGEDTH